MKKINGDNPGNFLNRLLYFYQCLRDHRKGKNSSSEIYKPTLSISNLNTFLKHHQDYYVMHFGIQ